MEKLVEQAIEQCRTLDHGRAIERTSVQRHAGALAAIAAIAALAIAFGPAYLRHGLSALLVVYRSAEASTPYSIEVLPGNTKVPRGADQAVKAKLVGFTSSDVSVMMRGGPNGSFDRVPLIASAQPGAFEGMLFHLEKPTEYYVESNGVRSGKFMLEVVDLPTVKELDLEYRFPAYTGLAPRKAEGGDVAAIRGTDVVLHVVPSMTTPDGKILLSDGGALPLTRQADGSLTGSFPIKGQGFYRIELTGPHGEKVEASPQYTIDVIDDQPPSVHFTKPGRDSQASPVEELFLEARADDDYGVKSLQLFYSVNGGNAEDDQPLWRREAAHRSERRPHDLPRGARPETGRLRVLLREGLGHRRHPGIEDHDERHLLRADPAVQEGLQAVAVAGRRRRRRRWRTAGRPAVAAAARDRRRDVQHRPRQGEDEAGEVPRERGVPQPRAGEAARAGGRARRQAEGAARHGGPRLQQDRRGAAESGG